MFLRILFTLSFAVISYCSTGQSLAQMLINGNDWRICGNLEKSDTLIFKKVVAGKPFFCEKEQFVQLVIGNKLSFRFLTWENGVAQISIPGHIELNEDTGDMRFYFEDGTSRDYLMLYIDNRKLILIDKNY